MKIDIHSFQSALKLKPNPQEKTIMIRISDPDYAKERDAELLYRHEYEDVLKVSFHDLTEEQVERVLKEEPDAPYRTMTKEQAKDILSFIQKHPDCDRLIVHCSAGISRSSAVGIGVAHYFQDKEMEDMIRKNDCFLPKTVIKRFMECTNR